MLVSSSLPVNLSPARYARYCCCSLGFTMLLTSQVISVAFYSEREKSDKFRSEALISA